MSKGTLIFLIAMLAGSITFYNINQNFLSLVCLVLFIGTAYANGNLG